MKLKVVFVILLILLLVGAAVADAKSGGRGGKADPEQVFIQSIAVLYPKSTTAKAVAVSTLPALARNKKDP